MSMRTTAWWLVGALALAACDKGAPAGAKPNEPAVAPGGSTAKNEPEAKAEGDQKIKAMRVGQLDKADTQAAPVEVLPWIEDDYPKALAAAKAARKPLFVDLWAPWCHTCLSMKAYVFRDPSLKDMANRFVWASIDTEKDTNAPSLAKFPIDAWPTYFLVDPADESLAGRWLGSASIPELRGFLVDGERAVAANHGEENVKGDPLATLRAADRKMVARDYAAAAKLYGEAVKGAPPAWPRRADALSSQADALKHAKDFAGCIAVGEPELDKVPANDSGAGLVGTVLDCADSLDKKDPKREPLMKRAVAKLEALAADPAALLSADDRGDMWREAWDAREGLGDAAGAKADAEKRLAMLNAAAASAPDKQAASAFGWARAETMQYLGHPEDAITMLTEMEKDVPELYNAPNWMARVYVKMGKFDEALAAEDRAIAKAYGPRKAGMMGVRADILEKAGKLDDARAAVEEQIKLYDALPAGQKNDKARTAAADRLAKLKAQPATAGTKGKKT